MDFLSTLFSFARELVVSTAIAFSFFLGGTQAFFSSYFPPPSPPLTVTTSDISSPVEEENSPAEEERAEEIPAVAEKKEEPKPVATTPLQVQKPAEPLISPEEVNIKAREAIVNILCRASGGSSVSSISGSGIIIDSRGLILTNAHIAQYFLLKDYPSKDSVDCVIRMGSPASPLYRATLVYLPPAWIAENSSQIKVERALGTGEHDYAFLLITSTTNPSGSLPSSFAHLALSGVIPQKGEQVLVAGYPAGFLDGESIEKNLYATSAFTSIGTLYSFDSDAMVDVVSLGGTVVSQGGSSGGAVVKMYDGKITGLISTATTGETTSSRDLRAITIGHVDRSLRAQGKEGLPEFLSRNMQTEAALFAAGEFETEKNILIEAIKK